MRWGTSRRRFRSYRVGRPQIISAGDISGRGRFGTAGTDSARPYNNNALDCKLSVENSIVHVSQQQAPQHFVEISGE